ncbi:MAG TPA: hypothetical protein VG498_19205 [Terriglobales bacterium]|nr:hypothetical protein [Terriglobales bacterium]
MSVTTYLRFQPAVGKFCKIRSHEWCRTTKESEWRGRHSGHLDGDQIAQAPARRREHDIDRILPVLGWLPFALIGTTKPFAVFLPLGEALTWSWYGSA